MGTNRAICHAWPILFSLCGMTGCLDAGFLSEKACDAQGRCLEGYVCDPDSRRCLPSPLPVVLYSFRNDPDPPVVPDESDLDPDILLRAADRDPPGIEFGGGAVTFRGGRLEARENASERLSRNLVNSGSFSIEAWVSTNDFEQTGPKRLVTLSSGAHSRSFTLGQEAEDLVVRLRTSITDENGTDFQQNVRTFTGDAVRHLVFVYDGSTGAARVYVDGQLRDVHVHIDGRENPAILDWDLERERFGLGDEFGADRRWSGSLHRVSIWNLPLDATQVEQLHAAGPDG